MEQPLQQLIVDKLPEIDVQCTEFLTSLIQYYCGDSEKLSENLQNYIKQWFPKMNDDIIKEFIISTIEITKDEKPHILLTNRVNKLEKPICIKDISISNRTAKLASNSLAARKTTVDKKRLEFEKRKINEKSEKRQQGASIQPQSIAELAATQQLLRVQKSKSMDVILENISLSFGSRSLLSNASVTLTNNRIFGLIGRNGYGKTTLLNAISNRTLSLPPNITIFQVKQEVVGDDTTVLDAVVASYTERTLLLNRVTEIENILESSEISELQKSSLCEELKHVYDELTEMSIENIIPKAAEILSGLGFNAHAQTQTTKMLSGGWRMRVSLAQALFMSPDLLLLDEPTNMLDLKSLYWLKNFLPTCTSTIVIVSHDRFFLDAVCSDIIHLTNQQLISYRGNYSTFEKTKTETAIRQKRQFETQESHRKHVQAFVDRFQAGTRASLVQSRVKALKKLPDLKPPEEEPKVVLRFADIEVVTKNLVQFDDASFSYSDDQQILVNLNFCVPPNSRIGVVGDNGSGKTTLLKLITGDYEPSDGKKITYPRLKIGYLAQHHLDQLPLSQCALEILSHAFPGKPELEYRNHLGQFGLSADLALRPVSTLSGGQKTRASLALIALSRPNLLIFDEPTNHLDIETVEALILALKLYKGAVIVVSHNEYMIRSLCTTFFECKNKKLRQLNNGIDEYISNISQKLFNSVK